MKIYTRKGVIAYDEKFHRGINIIRGNNSSGKSTITHFMFYVLGGAFNDWVKEAKKCSYVIAEVELNGATLTLKREINLNNFGKANKTEGMFIYWGEIEQAEKETEGWQKFNFNTTDSKKSFSNVLFENLDLPIVKGDNNITFHQILRLLYLDQDSPTNSLFYYEEFDTTLTRETTADLLLGVYRQELYDKKQRKVEADKELEDTKREIKVIKRFIQNPYDLIPSNLTQRISAKEKEINEIENEIIELKNEEKKVRFTKKTKLDFEKLNEENIVQRTKVKNAEQQIKNYYYEIEDTEYFIQALQNKLKALNKSILTRDLLGNFPIQNCPECLSPIEPIEDASVCKLCKTDIDDSFGITQARKIEQEIDFQIRESKNLIGIKRRQLVELLAELESDKLKLFHLQQKVNSSINDVKTVRQERLDQLYTDKGFIEGEIIQLRTLYENAEIYQSLIKLQSDLEQEIEALKYSIEQITEEQEKLKIEIKNVIEKEGIYLLNNDLKRQEDFYEAKEFHIDFRNNMAYISDKDAKYSASSSFYLKISARYSIFLASIGIDRMRYPRFIFCDNMEDKGIEKIRAENFQKILVEEAEKFNSENYQMIYTTSFIPDELNIDKYTVGDFYTEQNPSLKNV
ncbi:AAA domain-containing protein [Maribacter sedimenticola]|uniref:AAA domain-containing protein n=1 Tax=Maribacter sedimenticola TaxID=228956 RepID=A0ABY1SLH9_9FLAO|nr:AAA family ATPase [Maribacter sedimenticola]SNR74239.1 AAA domain-containing protein [Maribacter sedimenticola]